METRKALRLQSAMEYMTTYGWAIAGIVVALGVLFQLGVFNNTNLIPKVPAGSCQVLRPEGPWTTYAIATAGTCNGELPQYVLNTSSGAVYVSDSYFPAGSGAVSAFGWVRSFQSACGPSIYQYGVGGAGKSWQLEDLNGQACVTDGYDSASCVTAVSLNDGKWHFVGFTYQGSGTSVTVYVDSVTYPPIRLAGVPDVVTAGANSIIAGTSTNSCSPSHGFVGQLANVEVYNKTLSPGAVQNVYLSGIGGAPVELQSLISWWPLNGNPDDYSGNLNSGQIVGSGVSYSGSWQGAYAPP